MTYSEFLNNIYWRTIEKFPRYEINNKGEIRNKETGEKLARRENAIYVCSKGKSVGLTVWQEVLKAFPDVEFSEEEMRGFCENTHIKRGAYPWKAGNKPWRAVMKFQSVVKTIGYFKTKEEAHKAYYESYLKLRGYRPW